MSIKRSILSIILTFIFIAPAWSGDIISCDSFENCPDGSVPVTNAVLELQARLDALVAGSPATSCATATGGYGFIDRGVCVLDYSNSSSTTWNNAASTCVAIGGDLCSAAQYYTLSENGGDSELMYSGRAVWTNSFSDNDAGNKSFIIHSSDNPSINQQYAYACCGQVTPEPFRSTAETVDGVSVTYLHQREDTTFKAAARICHSRGSDLCSKSEYVPLNDAGRFSANVRRWTAEMSDNDGKLFDSVVGSNNADNPAWSALGAFACCGSTLPLDATCPGTELANGLCLVSVHDTEDASFFDAARACTSQGADVCSKSQMQALRNQGNFLGQSWTNDGADNDGGQVGGLLGGQPDDPNPSTSRFGYACCL